MTKAVGSDQKLNLPLEKSTIEVASPKNLGSNTFWIHHVMNEI